MTIRQGLLASAAIGTAIDLNVRNAHRCRLALLPVRTERKAPR